MKRYDSRQWTLSAAGAAVFVLLAVVAFPPWYTVNLPGGGPRTIHGTDDPFLGVWILALSAAAGLAAGVSAGATGTKGTPWLMAAVLLYGAAAFLAVGDATRESPFPVPSSFLQKGFGAWSAAVMALLGAVFAGFAIKVRREEAARAAAEPPPS